MRVTPAERLVEKACWDSGISLAPKPRVEGSPDEGSDDGITLSDDGSDDSAYELKLED